jgi:hypothetical protein
MRSVLLSLIFTITAIVGRSQGWEPAVYPKGYFRNPLNIPISLSGNFGELRPNHYHMGLDIKTERREGLTVQSAAEGYIARVKVEPFGFGQAIYINHPNGFTTEYCHLSSFTPALEAYVKQQQYRLESWAVFLDIPPGMFPVKKGDSIARSGNAGGSQAPHLHFEIRSTADDVNKNPMLFGLPLNDNTKPSITRLAVYDRSRSLYEQLPRMLPVRKTGDGRYVTTVPVIVVNTPIIGFAISASDTHNGSANANGIFQAILYDKDKPVIGFRMDNISYNDTRNINAHIDYRTRANGGPFLQQLFELPGYLHSIYREFNGNGALNIGDGLVHPVTIEVKDTYGNTALLQTQVQYRESTVGTGGAEPGKTYYPMMLDGFEGEDCEFYIGERCLYDSVHITYRKSAATSPDVVSAIHRIGAAYIPLQDEFLVRIKPSRPLAGEQQHRVVMQRFAGNKKEVRKVEWEKEWADARFSDLGNFQLVLDETPPEIVPMGFNDGADLSRVSRIVLTVKDNLESFKNFRAELDGKWLCFSNDKGKVFIYRFDEKCIPGMHELKVSVQDEAGNETVKTFRFTR